MLCRVAHKKHSAGRNKVKSGCRTCKIRKVKCDEAYPVCCRCVSTGRVCDGYGVWGGGGDFYHRGQRPPAFRDDAAIPQPTCISLLNASTKEKECYDWFRCRTVIKLPGSFISDFWTTLLLQASHSEPAVLHAVLALSSVHSGGILNCGGKEQSNNEPDKLEQFTLQQYVKAISHLQPHFLAKDRTSFRIALITCVVFISVDFLRGHLTTAQIHLQNGLKLLGEMQALWDKKDELLLMSPCRESVDDWIMEAFSRLHIQVELFKYLYQQPCLLLQAAEPLSPVRTFSSFKEAWHVLDRLLNNVFHLTKTAREHQARFTSLRRPPLLLQHQQRTRTGLAQWLHIYEASRKCLLDEDSLNKQRAYQLLRIYHTMLSIMADTCLYPGDEKVFDSHTDQFLQFIRQLADIFSIKHIIFPFQVPSENLFMMARSIVDMGGIAPLYYVAVKCRVHRIRLQAIGLLESTVHKEGIWDAKIAARVARKVMEIEERDFYKEIDIPDDFLLSSYPSPQDLSLPPLPESYRLRDVEVVLSGEPLDKILLFCKQKQGDMGCKLCIGEYHVTSQLWMDIDG